jgi:glucose-6-phosphate isomerase
MSTPTQLPAWKALEAHYQQVANLHMRDLFAQDPQRFQKFSRRFHDILLDFSKNRITDETFSRLIDLARQADVPGWAEKMFPSPSTART